MDVTFRHRIRVRYAEIDGQGVVFNAHWLTYFDDSCTRFMESLGFGPDFWVSEFDVMLVKASARVVGSGPVRRVDRHRGRADPHRHEVVRPALHGFGRRASRVHRASSPTSRSSPARTPPSSSRRRSAPPSRPASRRERLGRRRCEHGVRAPGYRPAASPGCSAGGSTRHGTGGTRMRSIVRSIVGVVVGLAALLAATGACGRHHRRSRGHGQHVLERRARALLSTGRSVPMHRDPRRTEGRADRRALHVPGHRQGGGDVRPRDLAHRGGGRARSCRARPTTPDRTTRCPTSGSRPPT